MRVRATRLFISTQYGNVDRGDILTVCDAHGKHFIENGLAEEIKSAGPVDDFGKPEVSPSVFPDPVAATPEPGLSSPEETALPSPTAKSSGPGAKATRKKKGLSR